MKVILIFYILLFGQGFAVNEINPSYYLMCFFIYLYCSFFWMNESSNWLSFPFLYILLLRRTMFVELGFHGRLAISQFLERLRVFRRFKKSKTSPISWDGQRLLRRLKSISYSHAEGTTHLHRGSKHVIHGWRKTQPITVEHPAL